MKCLAAKCSALAAAVTLVTGAAAPLFAHPGPRVWVGSSAGTLATYTSNNDLNPTTFTASRVFIGGVDEDTLTANGRLDEYPVPGTGVYASEFPGYQVRTDGQSGLTTPSSFGFNLPSPLLVFDSANNVFKPSRQFYGFTSSAPQMAVSVGASTFVTGASSVNGTSFFSYNSSGDHAHLTTSLLGNGTQTVDGPHVVYALPFQLTQSTGGGNAPSLPYYVLFGRDISSTDVVFQNALGAANAAVLSSGGTWIADADGAWTTPGNWFANSPNSVGAGGTFGGAISAPRTITLNDSRTVGRITFDSAHRYTLSGSGTVNLQTSGPAGLIQALSGSHTIATNVNLTGDATAVVLQAGDTLTLSGTLINSGGTGTIFTKLGQGTVDVRNLRLPDVKVLLGSIRIAPNGSPAGTSTIGTLSIAGGATPIATLDLTDNNAIFNTNNYNSIRDDIAAARNGGAWDQPGITSAAARSHPQGATTLGVLGGADYIAVNGAGFDGFTVAPTDVLVKYTWYGDTDFNGVVDFDDYVRTDAGFNTAGDVWVEGDFDGNGVVDFDDFVLIDLGFNAQNGTLRQAQDWLLRPPYAFLDGSDRASTGMESPGLHAVQQHLATFGPEYGLAFLAAVPEPSTALLPAFLMGWLGINAGRRRH